jgi:general secretion pathway protein J
MIASRRRHCRCQSGFTLLEVILAMMLACLLSVAMYKSAFVAFNARKTAMTASDPIRAVSIAADLVRRDLESVPPPTGILAGPFQGTHSAGPNGSDNDTLTFFTIAADPSAALPQNAAQDNPLSDGIRKIELGLRSDVQPPTLVRHVTRNLMPGQDANVEEEILARDVRGLSIRYFDGTNWQEDWDSTVVGDVLPVAVAITVELNDPDHPAPQPSQRKTTRVIALPCAKILDTATGTGGTQ